MKNKYVFKKLEDESRFHTSGKTFDLDRPMEKVAEVWGSLITLFGRTKYVAEDMEEAFSYFLEAIDNQNWENVIFLIQKVCVENEMQKIVLSYWYAKANENIGKQE